MEDRIRYKWLLEKIPGRKPRQPKKLSGAALAAYRKKRNMKEPKK